MRRRSTRARSAPPRIGPRRPRGFSLVELAACLVIVGILAGMAVPRLLDTQPFDERGYMDEISSAMRYAQAVAVASGCNVSFTINTAGYQAMQQPVAAGNTCLATSTTYTTVVKRADGTQLRGTPPTDANVSTSQTIIFGSAGQVTNYASPPPALVVGVFSLTIDIVSGFITVK